MPEDVLEVSPASLKAFVAQAEQLVEQHNNRCLFRVRLDANGYLVGSLDKRDQVIAIDEALASSQTSPASTDYNFAQELKTTWMEYDYTQKVLVYFSTGSMYRILTLCKPWLP